MVIVCIISAIVFSALCLYSCCVISGRASRLEEKELWEKEYGTNSGTDERVGSSE